MGNNPLRKIGEIIVILLLLDFATNAQNVENEHQTRTSISLSKKLNKKLKLCISPELRLDENFALDKYQFEAELGYQLIKILSLEATYRFIGNLRDSKDTEYLNRYAISATLKKEFNRFEPSIKINYTDYTDDDDSKEFLRYKTSVKYNIPKCKITPSFGIEFFQQLNDGDLYKMRYSTGIVYKLCKKNYLGAYYKLDYYLTEAKNKHILGVNYKIKF